MLKFFINQQSSKAPTTESLWRFDLESMGIKPSFLLLKVKGDLELIL